MAGPMPGLLSLMEELYGRINKERLFGGGVRGAATRGLLGAQPAEDMTPTQRDVYENAVRLAAPALGAGKAAITAASAVKLGKMSKDEFLGAPKIVGKKDASALKPMALKGIESEAEAVPFMGGKYTARYTPDGAAVYDGDKVIASYNFGDTLVVDPKYRKQGIGEELVYQQRTFFPEPAKASTRNVVSQRIQENVWDRIQNDLNDPSKTIPSPIVGRSLLEQAPQAQAMETARQNAVKMLGLPESNTAMDRARAMGFVHDELFHGTVNAFPAFKVSDRSSVYATDSPAIADIYANATGRHKGLREVNAGPNVMPLMYRGKLLEVSDQGQTGGGWLGDNLAAALGTEPRRNLVKEVPSKGYSGIKVNDMDDLGGRQSQYIFPDPAVLRSRFAAFDPARIDEKDLLASLAAMGITLPLTMGLLSEQID